MPVMMGLLLGFAVCGICYALATVDHECERFRFERWIRNKKALTERPGHKDNPQMVLTRADIAALASRLIGHARLLPRSSERADISLAATILRTIAQQIGAGDLSIHMHGNDRERAQH